MFLCHKIELELINPIHYEWVDDQLKISYCWTRALWTAKISPQKKIIWKRLLFHPRFEPGTSKIVSLMSTVLPLDQGDNTWICVINFLCVWSRLSWWSTHSWWISWKIFMMNRIKHLIDHLTTVSGNDSNTPIYKHYHWS